MKNMAITSQAGISRMDSERLLASLVKMKKEANSLVNTSQDQFHIEKEWKVLQGSSIQNVDKQFLY